MGVPQRVLELARGARHITVLTGAGMSAESGIPTFRDSQTGLWTQFDPSELASPQGWEADPDLVWAWYRWRVGLMGRVEPNAGHRALAEWPERANVHVQIVTQNIDDLHERAGSDVLAHLHGSIFEQRCDACGTPWDGEALVPEEPVERLAPPRCDACGSRVRPGVVWFGEALPPEAFDRAEASIYGAELVLVIGTSGIVYPAAGLPLLAAQRRTPLIEINPDETDISHAMSTCWRSTAASALPELVDALTARA